MIRYNAELMTMSNARRQIGFYARMIFIVLTLYVFS